MDYVKFIQCLAAETVKPTISQKEVFNAYMSSYDIKLIKEFGYINIDGVTCEGYADPMERAIHVCDPKTLGGTDDTWRTLWHEAAHTTGWFVEGRESFGDYE